MSLRFYSLLSSGFQSLGTESLPQQPVIVFMWQFCRVTGHVVLSTEPAGDNIDTESFNIFKIL